MNNNWNTFKKHLTIITLLSFIVTGCGGGGGDSGGGNGIKAAPTLSSIAITPTSNSVIAGVSSNFVATGTYSDGTTAAITSQVTWVSSGTAVATINTAGLATGVAVGSASITATLSGVSSSAATLTVLNATLTSISITPTTTSSSQGQAVAYAATGTYSTGATGILTAAATWTSSNTSVATISSAGTATTVGGGTTNIAANLDGIISNGVTLTVTPTTAVPITGAGWTYSGGSWSTVTDATVPNGGTVIKAATITHSQSTTASITLNITSAGNVGFYYKVDSEPLDFDTLIFTIDGVQPTGALWSGYINWTFASFPITTGSHVLRWEYKKDSSLSIGADTAWISQLSIPAAAVTVVPNAPVGIFAISGTNQVSLSWDQVTGATSYNIYWGTTTGTTTASTKITGATSPYLHTGLSTGLTYYYRVSALNTAGEILSAETFSFLYTAGNAAGLFGATGSLVSGRDNHTATLLPNGKVLVAGGHNSGGALASAEIYNPATGIFTATGSMTTARYYHTAELLPNGKVLITGGSNGSHLRSAELYDPATGVFSVTGSLWSGRYNHTTTLLPNGKVLVAGGKYDSVPLNDGSGRSTIGGLYASTEIYDPAAGSFSASGSMSTVRQNHSATLLPNGNLLIAGGSNSAGGLTSSELYNLVTGNFSVTGNMTVARDKTKATRLPNGKVLVTGGYGIVGGSYTFLTSTEVYDPVSGLWSSTGSLAAARENFNTTLLPNGKVLVTGGYIIVGGSATFLASAEVYDPVSGLWSTTGNLSTARNYHTSTLLPNGKVLTCGGIGTTAIPLQSTELFQ